jgi:hypothetical protein
MGMGWDESKERRGGAKTPARSFPEKLSNGREKWLSSRIAGEIQGHHPEILRIRSA